MEHLHMFIRTWNSAKLQQLQQLYQSGLSMRQVGIHLNTSLGSIAHIMQRYQIPRRSATQTKHIAYQKSPQSFTPINVLSHEHEQLKIAGLMLYWAEGAKRGKVVDLTNANSEMIQMFCTFLRVIYRVTPKRLRVYLYCHSIEQIPEHIAYWSKLTGIPQSQFTKPYVKENNHRKHSIMPHGLVHIRYADKRLHDLILFEIHALFTRLICQVTQVVNETGL